MENCVASSGFVVIRSKQISPKYIYTILKDSKITEYLILNSTGTLYPAVNPSVFEKIKIKIPKNKQLIQELEIKFQQIEMLQHEVKTCEESYKNLIQELSKEAMPQQINSVNSIITENIIENNDKEVIEIIPKKIIKNVSKKTKKLIIEE
jgi:hypothetical protein